MHQCEADTMRWLHGDRRGADPRLATVLFIGTVLSQRLRMTPPVGFSMATGITQETNVYE
jgi:hypothetical protein